MNFSRWDRKYLIIQAFLLTTFYLSVSAQSEFVEKDSLRKNLKYSFKRKTEFQIFAGPSVSFLRGNLEVDNTDQNERNPKYGYSIGVDIKHTLVNNFSLSYGLIYEKKGGISHSVTTYFDQIDQSFKQGTIEYEYEYEYFTVPIQIFHSLVKSDNFSVGIGPFFGFLKKQIRVRKTLFPPGSISYDDETNTNTKLDFGIIVTMMYKVPINSKSFISFQVTNTLGLINIRPNLYQGQAMKTNNTSLLIGLITKGKNYE